MEFYQYPLARIFDVPKIITIHYFEYGKDFVFAGESHDFWEFLCVDKGTASITAGTQVHVLKKGDIIFHKPGQFHSVATDGVTAPNLVVVSFVCNSPSMSFFENKIFRLGELQRRLLAAVIAEAKDAFLTPLDNPFTRKMEANPASRPGAEQMIQLSLEHFLISLYRKDNMDRAESQPVKSMKSKRDQELFQHLKSYMQRHISQNLTVDKICRDNLVGASQLQKLFRANCGCGIIEYFSRLKIQRAKELIREQNMNFTQIADCLGYTSIHYFSRQFKKLSGMTPSEYALSIKALSESGSSAKNTDSD